MLGFIDGLYIGVWRCLWKLGLFSCEFWNDVLEAGELFGLISEALAEESADAFDVTVKVAGGKRRAKVKKVICQLDDSSAHCIREAG